ncbi:MAG: sulfatase [Spirochaetota bacterium]|nr:sulfatase [Spirochaetota bacterium]
MNYKSMMRMMMKSKAGAYALSFSCGAAVYFIEYLFCLLCNSYFAVMGVKSHEIEKIVFSQFKYLIVLSQLKIFFVYIVIGGISGLCICYLVYLYSEKFRRELNAKKIIISTLFFTFALSLIFLIYDISTHPALYNEVFYAKGGILSEFQIFLTDRMPRFIMMIFRIIIILLFLPFLMALVVGVFKKIITLFRMYPRFIGFTLILIPIIVIIILSWGDKNEGPNLLILSSDSFRYDRISAYGNKKNLTPNIDKLINEGFSFTNLHVQLPRTFPSWYCILTGEYPSGHGIRHMFPRREDILKAEAYLPLILRERGYTTSVVADYAGDIFSKIKGFDRKLTPYFNFNIMIMQNSLEIHFLLLPYLHNRIGRLIFPELRWFSHNSDPGLLKDEVIRELNDLSKKKRFFLTVFFSVTHFPYASPYPYYGMFTNKDYRGKYKYLKKINDPTKTEIITNEDREQIISLFDGACRALDESIGSIIDELKTRGLYDNTIIIFTSDHGENIYDCDFELGHGQHFRGQYATHVPFIIKFNDEYANRMKIKKYDGIAEQIDFLPTIMDVMGINLDEDVDGVSFKDVIEGKRKGIKKIAYSETGIWFADEGDQFFQKQRIRYPAVQKLCEIDEYNNEIVLREEYTDLVNIAKHRTVFDENYKLLYIPTRDGVQFELYHLRGSALKNLYHKNHPHFKSLYGYLKRFMKRTENAEIINGLFIPKGMGNRRKDSNALNLSRLK